MPEIPYTMGSSSPGAEVRATPPTNPLALKASEAIGAVHGFMGKPFGYDNPPGQMLGDFLGLSDLKGVLERIGYGERLTEGQGWNLRIPDETIGAAGALPFGTMGKAGKLGRLAFGEKTAAEALNPEIKLLHSSPHKFDEFDIDKHMGKGEGAQMYGKGAYATDDPGVHKHYNRQFQKRMDYSSLWTGITHNGKPVMRAELDRTGGPRRAGAPGPVLDDFEHKAKENVFMYKGVQPAIDRLTEALKASSDHIRAESPLPNFREMALKEHERIEGALKWLEANKHQISYVDPHGQIIFKGEKWDRQDGYPKTLQDQVLTQISHIRDESDPIAAWRKDMRDSMRGLNKEIKFAKQGRIEGSWDKESYIRDLEVELKEYQDRIEWLNNNVQHIKIDKSYLPPTPKAQRYEAEFPDEHVNKLLHLDKPYSEQTPYVQRRIQKITGASHENLLVNNRLGRDMYDSAGESYYTSPRKGYHYIPTGPDGVPRRFSVDKVWLVGPEHGKLTGSEEGIYHVWVKDDNGVVTKLSRAATDKLMLNEYRKYAGVEGDLRASYTLRDAGIPGHKYYASGSRGKGKEDRKHNYVIYPGSDKKYLKITKREDVE